MTSPRPGSEGGQLAAQPPDDIAGDIGDQGARLQALAEQEAIAAALEGHVSGSDSLDERGPFVEPLEGGGFLDEGADSSDDPVHGGGSTPRPEGEEDGATAGLDLDAFATDEGASPDDDGPWAPSVGQGDPDLALAPSLLGDDDLDTLADHGRSGLHDPDDPDDPDGYGVPPGTA